MTIEQSKQMEALKAELRAANAYGRQLRKQMAEINKKHAKPETPPEPIEPEAPCVQEENNNA